MQTLKDGLLTPHKLWLRSEILTKPCPIPRRSGIYAWYFREIPDHVPLVGCHTIQDLTLLYLGIAPSRQTSSATLRSRIRGHLRGNASASTLRLTLGCLLADRLGLKLRASGRTSRLTFGNDGEATLSAWLSENAMIAWVETERPWEFERHLINSFTLPLNLQYNEHHSFYEPLRSIRKASKQTAGLVNGR